jgi:hypothetical protein
MELFNRPGLRTHLDAETLAAFAERFLRGEEEAAVFAHLAECEICREYLAAHAELHDFQWRNDRLQKRRWPHSLRATAGFAGAAAALWLLFFSHTRPPIAVATSRTPVEQVPSAPTIKEPIAEIPMKKPGPHYLRAAKFNAPAVATRHLPIGAHWGSDELWKLSTGDRLAARNSQRFLTEVTLATVAFGGQPTASQGDRATLSRNEIALQTPFGDRRIPLEGRRRFGLVP